ncbi:MAG: AMP-binding protein [Gemmatimonadetes bacterium]|nr:AMP-binding protein [Gemmatimonadota bacterium]
MADAPVDVARAPLLVAQLRHWARVRPDALAWAVYPAGHAHPVRRVTWGDWARAVDVAAAALLREGVAPGDRVAVFAGNRLLWPVLDLALQQLRAVGVGVYPSSTAVQVAQLLEDCAPVLVVADSADRCALVREAARRLGWPAEAVRLVTDDAVPGVPTFEAWCAAGGAALRHDAALAAQLRARAEAVAADDLAALIYTSGSTGAPKGAMITHRCLAASAASVTAVLGLTAGDRALAFLPFSHAAERMFGQGTRLAAGMATALVEDPADLFAVCADFGPTLVGGLPRIFERVYERTEVARRTGGDPRAALAELLGPRVRLATSGGAPLPSSVAEALGALGCPIVGAYGQTEHLCVAMNRPAAPRTDVVGPPMPGTEVRVAEDGELLVRRSALTFSGYWGRPEESAAAFTSDGVWLRTGDRAVVDATGALTITGRIKELIALSTGRKVAPLPIEGALADTPFIAHAVCHGEGRKHLVALLALRRPVVEAWARERGVALPWGALVRHPTLREQLAAAVDGVNAGLPRTDRVVAWAVTEAEFSVDTGELTPTFKVKRAEVEARHAALLASLYTPHPSEA